MGNPDGGLEGCSVGVSDGELEGMYVVVGICEGKLELVGCIEGDTEGCVLMEGWSVKLPSGNNVVFVPLSSSSCPILGRITAVINTQKSDALRIICRVPS